MKTKHKIPRRVLERIEDTVAVVDMLSAVVSAYDSSDFVRVAESHLDKILRPHGLQALLRFDELRRAACTFDNSWGEEVELVPDDESAPEDDEVTS